MNHFRLSLRLKMVRKTQRDKGKAKEQHNTSNRYFFPVKKIYKKKTDQHNNKRMESK